MRLKNLHCLHEITFFIITLFLLTTYGMECIDKLTAKQIPGWFIMTFSPTLIGQFPGVTFSWYFLGVFELIISLIYCISFFKKEILLANKKLYLRFAVILSLLHMVLLNLGQRLAGDYAGAAGLVNYLTFMIIVLIVIDRAEAFRFAKDNKTPPFIF